MKAKNIFLIIFVLVLISESVPVDAAITPPEVVNIPYTTEVVDADRDNVVNLSTALVGPAEIPLISYVLTSSRYLIWAHPATFGDPGNCWGEETGWKCVTDSVIIQKPGSLSKVATEIYGSNSFGLAWAFDSDNGAVDGLRQEFRDNMIRVGLLNSETLIQVSKFGDAVVGAPSIALVGGHYRMAVVIRQWATSSFVYKLVYMRYVGGENNSCSDVLTGYKCEVIDTSIFFPILSPSLAYAGGDTGIAYVIGNAVSYAYPQISTPTHGSNCGPMDDVLHTWRCLVIEAPEGDVTVGDRVALAFGSDSGHALITYSISESGQDILRRATYVLSSGNCGRDVLSGGSPYGWDCQDVDTQIENINLTTFAVTFDPNDFPVISWNNKIDGDMAHRLWIAYPRARLDQGAGWYKQRIDGNDWSYTGTHNDISINSSGLTFLGYIQPYYQGCSDCIQDIRDRLKAAMQWFNISLPVIMR